MHHRGSIRLKEYDYGQPGAYFVTICAYKKACIFGEVKDEQMKLNDIGRMIMWHWNRISQHFPNAELDEGIIMPNHVHGIVEIIDRVGAKHSKNDLAKSATDSGMNASPLRSLSAIIQNFKSVTSRKFNKMRGTGDGKLWQRNYYERIIRDEDELNRIREYIIYNPLKWNGDDENPVNFK